MLRGKVIKLKSLRFFSLSFNIKEIKKKALSKQNLQVKSLTLLIIIIVYIGNMIGIN